MSEQYQTSQENQTQDNASDWKDWVKELDEKGTKYDCDPTVLSDSDFVPPVEIQFQDWGEMMKGFMKMGEEMKKNMPNSLTPPSQ